MGLLMTPTHLNLITGLRPMQRALAVRLLTLRSESSMILQGRLRSNRSGRRIFHNVTGHAASQDLT